MFCGKHATTDACYPNRTLVRTVVTLPLHSKVLEQCTYNRGDVWGSEVQTCLHGCGDLVAAEAVCHSRCILSETVEGLLEAACSGFITCTSVLGPIML